MRGPEVGVLLVTCDTNGRTYDQWNEEGKSGRGESMRCPPTRTKAERTEVGTVPL